MSKSVKQTKNDSKLVSKQDGQQLNEPTSGLREQKLVVPSKSRKNGDKSASSKQVASNKSDSSSISTANSDLSSSDEAASVVSRLSQIVIEEEEKLNQLTQKTTRRSEHGSSRRDSLGSNEIVPEIQINDGTNKVEIKMEPSMRRNVSSSFLPERGDLRQLGSLRTELQNGSRNRSNTAGSMDKSCLLSSKDEAMLNIKRSAWTLSEFDQTFNKDASTDDNVSVNMIEIQNESAATENSTQDKSTTTGLNLFIQASKNSANLSQQHSFIPTASDAVCSINNGSSSMTSNKENRLNPNFVPLQASDKRRLSICSFTSSITDSIYNGFGKKRRQKHDDRYAVEEEQSCMRSCFNLQTFSQYLPILEWLPGYKLSFLWGDIMAGLAVAVLNISTSLSAAVVAETDLSVAFRSSIINTFVYSILCSSRHTSFGSWSIMSQMLLVSVQRALNDELILERLNMGETLNKVEYENWSFEVIIMYTFLIGLVQLVCGLLNLGNLLSSFIPEALCSSMIAATAFIMAIGQLANMCGTTNKILWSIEKNTTEIYSHLKDPPVDITDLFAGLFNWVKQIILLAKHHEQINYASLLISSVTVILLFLNQFVFQKQLERLLKQKILIPFEMILLIGLIIISYWLNLSDSFKVSTCGPVQLEMVVPSLPDFRLIRELWDQSLATALISYTMVYIMAKTYSNKLNYEVDCNQELIACGAGNLVGGLFDALPATASFSRTASQVEAGGQTQMASLINCFILVVMIRLLGHHIAFLPVCFMAACLFFGFVRMMTRMTEVFIYWRVCKVDFLIWIVTFLAILTMDLVNGFVYGFIFSITTMLYRAQNRRCYMLGSIGSSDVYVPLVKYPTAQEIEGIKIFQFCGPLHYVCSDLFERLLRSKTRVNIKQVLGTMSMERDMNKFNPTEIDLPSHIIIDFSMISYIDSAGIHVIQKIVEDYKRINITVLIASMASHVASVIKSEPALWNRYKNHFYVTLADAVHCASRNLNQQNQHRLSIKVSDN